MAFTIIHIFTTASSYTSLFLIGAGIIFHIGDCMPQHPSTRNPIHHVTHKSPPHLHRCPKRDEEPLYLAIDAARLACWNSFYWRRRSLRYQPGTIKRRHRAHTTHRCTMSFYIGIQQWRMILRHRTINPGSQTQIPLSHSADPLHEITNVTNQTWHLCRWF